MKQMPGHLQYDWWKYIAALLIPLVLWGSVFSIVAKPKANERLNVLFLGEGLHAETLQEDLTARIKDCTQQNIKSVQVSVAKFEKDNFSQQLIAATYSYDIIIIGQSQMTETIGQDYFQVLPEEFRSEWDSVYEEKIQDQQLTFGVVMWDDNVNNTFGKYYDGLERCFAFISPQTHNLYPFSKQSKQGDDAAVVALRWLMETV